MRLRSDSVEYTRAVGHAIGAAARAGDVVLLSGGLGAGKTALTQGILRGLGSDEFARSPTFVLMNEYHARLTVYHMDLYRLDTLAEIDGLGLDDYLFGDGLCVIEWADKAEGYFPAERLAVSITVESDTERTLELESSAGAGCPMLRAVGELAAKSEGG